jgi:hypothetical protein
VVEIAAHLSMESSLTGVNTSHPRKSPLTTCIEGRNAMPGLYTVRAASVSSCTNEVKDRLLWGTGVPRWQWIVRLRRGKPGARDKPCRSFNQIPAATVGAQGSSLAWRQAGGSPERPPRNWYLLFAGVTCRLGPS